VEAGSETNPAATSTTDTKRLNAVAAVSAVNVWAAGSWAGMAGEGALAIHRCWRDSSARRLAHLSVPAAVTKDPRSRGHHSTPGDRHRGPGNQIEPDCRKAPRRQRGPAGDRCLRRRPI